MATPRRRSSRLHGVSTPAHSKATPTSNKLSSLLERDESPTGPQANIDAVMSTPMAPPNTAIAQSRFGMPSSAMKTPHTISRIPFSEMHPSKVHFSTTKTTQNCPLSSHPVESILQSNPSKAAKVDQTPSKNTASISKSLSSPTFDFTFERPESELSAETQKIMDSVREEAAKIKAQMIEQRDKQVQKEGEVDNLYGVGGRKIAKPKGKSGRFSDVHKQEFQKMASITNHASTWKTKLKAETPSLKRTSSKAGLDGGTPKLLPKSKSMRSLHSGSYETTENASPGKRMKRTYNDDASSSRPILGDTPIAMQNSPLPGKQESKLPSAVTTPTKASLARSASVKNMKTSMIPLSRSASTKTLSAHAVPKSEGSNKYMSSLARFGNMLHRSQPKSSGENALVEPSALPKADPSFEKELPSLPTSPSKDVNPPSTIKRVDFADDPSQKLTASPSRSHIPTPKLYHPSPKSREAFSNATDDPVVYPLIASSPNITTRRAAPTPKSPAAGPGNFTFRAEKTIQFSPNKPLPANPPSQTIRHVRPSGLPTPMAGSSFSNEILPAIPHGIGNKKRKHIDQDEDSDFEKLDNSHDTEDKENPAHLAKKQRTNHPSSSPVKLNAVNQSSPLKRRFGNKGAGSRDGAGGKRGLTLGRLNVLARPKDRR